MQVNSIHKAEYKRENDESVTPVEGILWGWSTFEDLKLLNFE